MGGIVGGVGSRSGVIGATAPLGILPSYSIEILLLGGGGGGNQGAYVGGGGGAGGIMSDMAIQVTTGITTRVTVGAGGATGLNGGNTIFGPYLTAYGGGAGGVTLKPTNAVFNFPLHNKTSVGGNGGNNGGSGGGGQENDGGGKAFNWGGVRQGSDGGDGGASGWNSGAGGGGFGTTTGNDGRGDSVTAQFYTGNGGVGTNAWDSWLAAVYPVIVLGEVVSAARWIAGGGAGSGHYGSQYSKVGGSGGGGNGATGYNSTAGSTNGAQYTGGGGGSVSSYTAGLGKTGGSGWAIIRYSGAERSTSGNYRITSGGYTYHVFTASGNYIA